MVGTDRKGDFLEFQSDTQLVVFLREYAQVLASLSSIHRCLALLIISQHTDSGISGSQIHKQLLHIHGDSEVVKFSPGTFESFLIKFFNSADLVDYQSKGNSHLFKATEKGLGIGINTAMSLLDIAINLGVSPRNFLGSSRNTFLKESSVKKQSSVFVRLLTYYVLLSNPRIAVSKFKEISNNLSSDNNIRFDYHLPNLQTEGIIEIRNGRFFIEKDDDGVSQIVEGSELELTGKGLHIAETLFRVMSMQPSLDDIFFYLNSDVIEVLLEVESKYSAFLIAEKTKNIKMIEQALSEMTTSFTNKKLHQLLRNLFPHFHISPSTLQHYLKEMVNGNELSMDSRGRYTRYLDVRLKD